jgi:hypothetical protein
MQTRLRCQHRTSISNGPRSTTPGVAWLHHRTPHTAQTALHSRVSVCEMCRVSLFQGTSVLPRRLTANAPSATRLMPKHQQGRYDNMLIARATSVNDFRFSHSDCPQREVRLALASGTLRLRCIHFLNSTPSFRLTNLDGEAASHSEEHRGCHQRLATSRVVV